MTDVRFAIRADGEGATREVERVKQSLNTLPAAARTAQGGLDGMGMSAAQTAAAMRQVPMQVTDIVTSLASGQPVMMVAIQQGGQLKDAFGGIVPAAKALSSTIAGMVNPFTLAAAAAAAVGAAWYQSEQQASAFSKALILSGNAIGMTTGQLQQMSATQGLAASALAEMAGSSNIAARDLGQFTAVAVEWERVTGQAVSETRKQFEELAKSPVDALIKLNDGTNFLTVAVLEQVVALKAQGKETEAAEVAQRAWAAALEQRAGDVQESTNKMVRAWNLVAREAAAAWAAMVRQWDDETPAQALSKLDQQIAALEGRVKNRPNQTGGLLGKWLGDDPSQLAGLKAQREAMAETIRLSERAQLAAAERGAAERKAVAVVVEGLKTEDDQRKRTASGAESASKARIRAIEAERQAREKLEEIISSALGRDEERQRKEEVEAAEAAIKVWEQEAEARTKARDAADKQVTSFATLLSNIQLETQYLQMSNQEREFATTMRELEVLGVEKGTAAWEAYAEALRGAIGERATVKAGIEASAALVRSGDRAADQVGQAFAQSIMDGGKSAAEQLERLFGSMVLTPMVNAVVNPMAQAVTGAFSGGGSSGGGSSAVGTIGQIAGLSGAFGTGLGASFGSMASAGIGGWASAAGSLMGTGTAAGAAAGLGMVAAPIAAAYLLYSLLSSGGEKRSGGTYGYSATGAWSGGDMKWVSDEVGGEFAPGQTRFIGGPSGGEIGGDTIRASVAATVEGINGLFDRLGSTDKIDQFWGKLEQSEKGRGGVFSGGTLASGASFGEAGWEAGTSRTLTTDEAIAAFALDLQQATIQALQAAADIPAVISDMLADVDAEALSQDQVSGLLQAVEAIVAVTDALSTLGVQAASVTTAMLEAAGGADALGAAAASYYQGYYSEGERVGALAEQLAGQFAALGMEMPGTRDEFRALVESLDLTTAQGQSAYGTLLTLSDAFGVVADSAAAAADESMRAAQESARAALDAQSAAIEDEIAAMVRAFGDLEGAMSALDAPAENLVEQWQSASQQLADMTRELDRILGTGEAGPFDALAQTVASLASASRGIEAIDQMRFGVATSAASDQSVELMAQRERELFAELRTAADPAAVAQELAQVALARIKMAGDLSGQALAEEYREQYESARAALELQRDARNEQIGALREQISAAERMRDIIGGMRGVIDDLLVGDLSALGPEGRLGAARQSYDRTLAGARAGDVSAMSEYADALRTYLGQSQSYYGGATSEYASAFATALAEAEEMAGAQVSDVELLSSQLETLQSMDIEQAEMRQTVIDTSAEQLAALDSIGAALRERESALQQRQDEQASAARQQVDLLSAIVEGQEAEIRQRAAAMQALQEQLAKLQDQIGRIQSSVESIEVAA